MSETNGRTHRYHAEATALEGQLNLPYRQLIERQAHAKVPETGGYLSQHTLDFRVEGIVSYAAAHTQVSGHKDDKPGHGWNTLATSVIEDLNVLNVVTADRVVAQVSIEHPLEGYVPKVTYLGTNFYNLRIGGFPIQVNLNLNLLEGLPERDAAFTRHEGFMRRVAERVGAIRKHGNALPDAIAERYGRDPNAPCVRQWEGGESTEFSLVDGVEGTFPGTTFGNVLEIPNFGRVFLGTVRIEHTDPDKGTDIHKETLIELSMIEVKMGCIAAGAMAIGMTKNNGSTNPGGG
jgi:hypothetical protein